MKLEQLLEGVPFTLVQGSLNTEISELHVELHRHTRGLQFAVDDPACHFIHQHTDDSAMQGVDPALVILTGIPDGKHILTLFPKLKMQSHRIIGSTANAVVTLLVQIWI